MNLKLITISLLCSATCLAQGPEITSWILNTTGAKGYNNISSNIQQVQYSTNNVYVSASCIPGYAIGPWAGNPNVASNQNFVYKITRNPQKNTGTATTIGLGHTGVWTNGVSIFNVSDGMSYNNAGVWNRNAYFWEGSSFDNCLGHPQQNGEYHHHVSPNCLYNINDSTKHSPLIGYAFDGYPVYGAYGYASATSAGTIKRMRSSYTTTTTSTRTNGPSVSSTYPVGCFMEDYVYTTGSGDLDERNGRFCVTPEYPNGTYAYFATLNGSLTPQFPYTMYKTYYGIVQSGNTGPTGGQNTITESVVTYSPVSTGIQYYKPTTLDVKLLPNENKDHIFLYIEPILSNNFIVTVTDITGKEVYRQVNVQPTISYALDMRHVQTGMYTIQIRNNEYLYTRKMMLRY